MMMTTVKNALTKNANQRCIIPSHVIKWARLGAAPPVTYLAHHEFLTDRFCLLLANIVVFNRGAVTDYFVVGSSLDLQRRHFLSMSLKSKTNIRMSAMNREKIIMSPTLSAMRLAVATIVVKVIITVKPTASSPDRNPLINCLIFNNMSRYLAVCCGGF